jgi:hypothetical protein
VVSQKGKADFPWTVLSAEVRANSFDYLIVTGASFLLWGEPGLPASGFGPFRFAGLIFLRAGILCWIFTAGWILVRAGFLVRGGSLCGILVPYWIFVVDYCGLDIAPISTRAGFWVVGQFDELTHYRFWCELDSQASC